MAKHYLNLPGDCYVNRMDDISNGIALPAEFLSDYGFDQQQKPTILTTRGHIIITNHPNMCNIIDAIEELQLSQDELKQNFEPAICALLALFVPKEQGNKAEE